MATDEISGNKLNVSRRNLPHWQIGGSWYFITFRTKSIILPEMARSIVQESILSLHGVHYDLALAVVMPDHAHLLFRPIKKDKNLWFPLSGILRKLKGGAARKVNILLKRSGALWLDESFDRIVRDGEEWGEKYEYVRNNAVKAGLACKPEDYPWLIDGPELVKRY